MFEEIKASLQQLYQEDERPWLVGFSGGKDSTMLASLIFDAVPVHPRRAAEEGISDRLHGHPRGNSRHRRDDRRHAGPDALVFPVATA